MNRLLTATIISLALFGCGGGDSDTEDAPEPPAPDMGGMGDGAPDEPAELAAECSKNPPGSVQSGQNATATYTFNQSFDGTATITPMCPGVLFQPTVINIEDGQGSETLPVPEGCEGQTLTMVMDVDGIDVGAQCAWNVTAPLGETI